MQGPRRQSASSCILFEHSFPDDLDLEIDNTVLQETGKTVWIKGLVDGWPAFCKATQEVHHDVMAAPGDDPGAGPRLPGPVPPEEWTEGHFKLCLGPFRFGCIKHEYTDTSRRQHSGGWSQG